MLLVSCPLPLSLYISVQTGLASSSQHLCLFAQNSLAWELSWILVAPDYVEDRSAGKLTPTPTLEAPLPQWQRQPAYKFPAPLPSEGITEMWLQSCLSETPQQDLASFAHSSNLLDDLSLLNFLPFLASLHHTLLVFPDLASLISHPHLNPYLRVCF